VTERSDASPASTKVSVVRIALNRCSKTEMRCQKSGVAWVSRDCGWPITHSIQEVCCWWEGWAVGFKRQWLEDVSGWQIGVLGSFPAHRTLQPRRKATATRTASSDSLSPQLEMGSAKSQSPPWGGAAAIGSGLFVVAPNSVPLPD